MNHAQFFSNSSDITWDNIETMAENETSNGVCASYMNSYEIEEISSSGAYAIIEGYDCTKGGTGMCQKGKVFYFHKSTGEYISMDDQRVTVSCL